MSAAASAKIEKNEQQVGDSRHSQRRNPPELRRNEAAARVNPIQVSGKTYDDNVEENNSHRANEDDDDPCVKSKERENVEVEKFRRSPGVDPRFQQQNQTLRCFVMYRDFYRCEGILGEGHEACTWFRDVFTSICPNAWLSRWDELRAEGRMPWDSSIPQGKYSKNPDDE